MLRKILGAWAFAFGILTGSEAMADVTDCGASEAAIREIVGTVKARKWELSGTIFDGPLKLALSDEALSQDSQDSDPNAPHPVWFLPVEKGDPVPVKPPSKEVMQAFIERARVSATTCPNVLEFAHRAGIAALQQGSSRRNRKPRSGLYDRTSLELSRAIVSADGTEALVYASSLSGPLNGGGYLMLFRRDTVDKWKLSGQLRLWVS